MKASKVIQIAWKGLSKNKLRSLLTMLGVIIGVAAVITMIAISAGAEAAACPENRRVSACPRSGQSDPSGARLSRSGLRG